MILVEKHIINNTHPFFNECDDLSYKSKNLYNRGLYNVRQHYFEYKKYLTYNQNFHLSKTLDEYSSLPRKVSNQTLKLVDQNFKSFFGLLKTEGSIDRIPKYLDKEKGRYIVKYEKQSLSIKEFKKTGNLLLSQTNIKINTKVKNFNDIKEVRIIPRSNHYVIEVVYEKMEKVNDGKVIASIDSGLNNLATLTFSNGKTPLIINGRPLKSINQYYNKKKSFLLSELEVKQKHKTSKNISKLTFKRNNKINDYLHKSSRLLVNSLVSNQVGKLIIGKNTGQKQNINIGRVNNQNFTQIPIFRFLDMVAYKARLEGIEVVWQEESYTSKCSFLDNERIQKHETYMGKRIKRGLFKTHTGHLLNADVNGSYNIMKKAIPNVFSDGIEGFAVNPVKLMV